MQGSCGSESTAPSAAISNLSVLQNRLRKIRRDNKIKIDISRSEYALLKTVALGEMGWRLWTREQSKEDMNLQWVDSYVSDEQVRKLRPYQRINHFPSSNELGKKNLLTFNLNAMKKLLPKEYDFYPETFNIPAETELFEKFSAANPDAYYIVKPCADSQGRGIYLTKSIDLSLKQEMIVQEYVEDPLLIDGMKFDLRIYVLLRSVNPLKIYVYEEGLSRLATCAYEKPGSGNQRNMRMHLTNYAINKFSPDFIFNKSEDEDNIGHKRSYTATIKIIQSLGGDIAKLQNQIDSVIVKTIMAAHGTLSKKYKEVRDSREESESVCFQILGFDILVKSNFEPVLLQVNHSPSFCTDSPLDLVIKKYLILDTFNLLNLSHEEKIAYFKSRVDQDPLNSNLGSYSPPRTSCRSGKEEGEELGGYRKLFPLENVVECEEVNRTYYNVLRVQKLERSHRMYQRCSLPATHKACLNCNVRLGESVLFQGAKEENNPSYTLYQAINNLYAKRGSVLKENSCRGYRHSYKEEEGVFEFEEGLQTEVIKKQESKVSHRQVRRERHVQKKVVLPIAMNNVSIRLDDNYSHKHREIQSNTAYYSTRRSRQYPFKIHSVFNMGALQVHTQRKKGLQTSSLTKQTINESLMRNTNMQLHPNYSRELREKIESIQLGRLKLMRSKKLDRNNFIIIKSKSIDRKSTEKEDGEQ